MESESGKTTKISDSGCSANSCSNATSQRSASSNSRLSEGSNSSGSSGYDGGASKENESDVQQVSKRNNKDRKKQRLFLTHNLAKIPQDFCTSFDFERPLQNSGLEDDKNSSQIDLKTHTNNDILEIMKKTAEIPPSINLDDIVQEFVQMDQDDEADSNKNNKSEILKDDNNKHEAEFNNNEAAVAEIVHSSSNEPELNNEFCCVISMYDGFERDFSDSKSSSETPPSYNQLNYNENINRYFQSNPKTTAENNNVEDENNFIMDTDEKNTTNNQKYLSFGCGSAENFSSGSNQNDESSGTNSYTSNNEDYKPPQLTESVLVRHNEDMEKIMLQKHKKERSHNKNRAIEVLKNTNIQGIKRTGCCLSWRNEELEEVRQKVTKRSISTNNEENELKKQKSSCYSSSYSSFLKTDSNDDSTDDASSSNNNNNNNRIDDDDKRANQRNGIYGMRKKDPAWIETVSVSPDLVYRYQMHVVNDIDEILKKDLKILQKTQQPVMVNDQLQQLYLEMELEGLSNNALTLEENSSSSSSSSSSSTSSSSDDEENPTRNFPITRNFSKKKRRISYNSLMMICEENAPFPPPDANYS